MEKGWLLVHLDIKPDSALYSSVVAVCGAGIQKLPVTRVDLTVPLVMLESRIVFDWCNVMYGTGRVLEDGIEGLKALKAACVKAIAYRPKRLAPGYTVSLPIRNTIKQALFYQGEDIDAYFFDSLEALISVLTRAISWIESNVSSREYYLELSQ